jgi:hypothetical protein
MTSASGAHGERIVKIPFPVTLIRRMDEAIVAGRGGFETRAELMQEAVENLLNELDYPEAPPEIRGANADPAGADRRRGAASEIVPPVGASRSRNVDSVRDERPPLAPPLGEDVERHLLEQVVATLPVWERDELTLGDLAGTALHLPARKPTIIVGTAAHIDDEPLLGLHGRDYPSIWALERLARYTADGLIPFEKYRDDVLRAAWYFGGQLNSLEQFDGRLRKLAVLFPTNIAKQPSAARGFQAFAIGSVTRSKVSGALKGSGPLFAWRAIQVQDAPDMPVGLTEIGWRLISELEGLSLDLPHPPKLMKLFMTFLSEHAPADRWGFDCLLRGVAERPSRDDLVDRFKKASVNWSAAEASSIAQGYIARSREWGLVEPKLVDGRYWLTAGGSELLERTAALELPAGRQR